MYYYQMRKSKRDLLMWFLASIHFPIHAWGWPRLITAPQPFQSCLFLSWLNIYWLIYSWSQTAACLSHTHTHSHTHTGKCTAEPQSPGCPWQFLIGPVSKFISASHLVNEWVCLLVSLSVCLSVWYVSSRSASQSVSYWNHLSGSHWFHLSISWTIGQLRFLYS